MGQEMRRGTWFGVVFSFALVAASSIADEVVRRGAEIGDSPHLRLKDALDDPGAHADRTVIVEGKVDKVCQMKAPHSRPGTSLRCVPGSPPAQPHRPRMDQPLPVAYAPGRVCSMGGCWLELMPQGESRGVRVTFENYGFFVPKDSMGWNARLEGKFVREELSKRDVDHLVGEGATLSPLADGTAVQYSFVASAVELRRPVAEE